MEQEIRPYFVEILLHDLEQRKKGNLLYSMRAHARYLGMGSSTLSRVLNGEQELTPTMNKVIMKKLKLTKEQRLAFIVSVAEQRKHRAFQGLLKSMDLVGDEEWLAFSRSFKLSNPICTEGILSSSSWAVLIVSLEGRILFANEVARRTSRPKSYQLIGCTLVEDLLDPIRQMDATKVESHHKVTVKEQELVRIYRPIKDKLGELQAVLVQLDPSELDYQKVAHSL